MYSTNIEDERWLIKCLALNETNVSINEFVVDTGAKFTCCRYNFIDIEIKEANLTDNEIKYVGGFVKGEYLKFYKYSLKQFTVGNINMGKQDIWITFDDRITDIILGVDILKQIIMVLNSCDQKLYFFSDVDDYKRFEIIKK